ncbi:NACHT domain-containing protein [Nodosilinea sp. LEGE 07088]|uniref:NACHT domain-containing protein n=1 Tax=Nodosilinea sp. LEGE 07088 TaxID=2777968 RepID=UPI00187ED3E5|nr:NACHT domain-containing protein [Nodosilinea sp. LEGE 07088]MBE9137026.1 NACHT domain-containing protein [Nodosilinea sp. LEGE 07088]
MSQPPSPRRRQRLSVSASSVSGQIGQAMRDLWQFQFIFGSEEEQAREAQQNRQALIDKVRNYWIKGVLEKSLHHQVMIDLNLENRLDAVEQPFNMDWVSPERKRQSLPPGTKAIDVFDQLGEGATLLILGEPGAGKTITLLELARDFLKRAEENESQPIPVVFNLSSWKNQPIEDWLAHELWEKYQVSKELGKNWVVTENLLLLLDGLDEVVSNLRSSCVNEINEFVRKFYRTKVIICSRIKDYESINQNFHFQGSVLLKLLTERQIFSYLGRSKVNLPQLQQVIENNSCLRKLVKTPLLLNLAVLTFQDTPSHNISDIFSSQGSTKLFFDAYTKRMLFRRQKEFNYKASVTKEWLTILAKYMQKNDHSIFLIDNLQYNFLPKKEKLYCQFLGSFLTFLTVSCITLVVLFSLFFIYLLEYKRIASLELEMVGRMTFENYFVSFFRLAIFLWLVVSIVGSISVGFWGYMIKPIGILGWSWSKAKMGFSKGSLIGILVGLLVALGLIAGGQPSSIRNIRAQLFSNSNYITYQSNNFIESEYVFSRISSEIHKIDRNDLGLEAASFLLSFGDNFLRELEWKLLLLWDNIHFFYLSFEGIITVFFACIFLGIFLLGTYTGLISGLTGVNIRRRTQKPNENILNSARNSLTISLTLGTLTGFLVSGFVHFGGWNLVFYNFPTASHYIMNTFNPHAMISVSVSQEDCLRMYQEEKNRHEKIWDEYGWAPNEEEIEDAVRSFLPIQCFPDLVYQPRLMISTIIWTSLGIASFGMLAGLFSGGKACIRHFSLRLLLWKNKVAPWNYARFLDYACERIFLQKVGGSYIFIHRLLLEHFAQMELKE